MSLVGPHIRAVFFDAVGTLLFPEPSASLVYIQIASERGLSLAAEEMHERFLAAFRREEEIDRAAGWATSEAREWERWRRIVFASLEGAPDPDACFRQLYDHFAKPQSWQVNADAVAVFDALAARGIKLGLASNYDSRLSALVEGMPQLAPLRNAVVISSLVGFRKPAHEFFHEVARIAGHEAGEILFVGDDRENDFAGARAVGMQAVLLEIREQSEEIGPRIRRLAELV